MTVEIDGTDAPRGVTEWVSEARARWPLIALGEADFAAHLAILGRNAPAFPADAYLAAACCAHDPAALRALETEFVARVPTMVRRVDASPAFAADIAQRLRIRLLVSEDDAPPRLARYTGEVPLSAWLRVITLRLALNATRESKNTTELDAERDLQNMDDPELDTLRGQYREPFVRSFKAAIATLPKDDRTVLRLHYVDGVNIDGIGRIFQVHRATVARWLVRIRADVVACAKGLLAAELGAELDEAASVMGALAGEIDWTLSKAIGAT